MQQACPISRNRIDTNLVRIIALQVIAIALLLIYTQELIFALLLLFDFSVRILNLKSLSLFALIAKSIIKYFKIKAQPCDEAPKRFALYVGAVLISLFSLLYLFNFTLLASILVTVLLVCAFLEASFDYCLGCKIYHFIQYIQFKGNA
ncbi:MAG TPA: DUF4395 domain-containing protein [Campylobacterales bacterium]|nr:DUF4395 domain-containing protein [Campylobacterales bacterium]HHS92719.1 DUF4395 domain-containing protein [Campylobacterales bacterium]